MPRKPGHRQGVPRYRRAGQTTLDVGRLLQVLQAPEGATPNQVVVDACALCEDRCTGACDDELDE